MPDEIYGVMAVKNGQKQTIMNLSNARQKSYADLQNMTDAQKKGVIVCPDYPKEEFLVTANEVSYGNGTVEDALDELSGYTTLIGNPTYFEGSNLNKLYYSQIGQIVVGSGRIITTVDKPSGQANYLFNNLPIPIGFTSPVLNNSGNDNIIINGDGQLTSNLAITAGAYNLSFCYIAND